MRVDVYAHLDSRPGPGCEGGASPLRDIEYAASPSDACVSYVAARFVRSRQPHLPVEDCRKLLALAREIVEKSARGEQVTTAAAPTNEYSEALKTPRGTFVTLTRGGKLRGCIGNIFPDSRPLWESVRDNAVSAAMRDSRFEPVAPEEVDKLHIHISVLTVPRKVASADDITLGKHGIVIKKGMHRAVFLPQVAPEQGWDVETTLSHLSMKAGLPRDAWKSEMEFQVFEALVFAEGY
jgi:uncharacterized protein, PH0010 family